MINFINTEDCIVYFEFEEIGEYKCQVLVNGNIEYETILYNISPNTEYFISHPSIRMSNSILSINDIEYELHDLPLINIITRVSRKKTFIDCHNSVINQTYKNINHIVTYETEEMGDFIRDHGNLDILSLCKVTKLKQLDVYRSFTYNQYFKQDDLDSWDYKIWDGVEETFERAGRGSTRMRTSHFPFESYLNKAEKKVEYGWIMYLDDDDDILYDKTVIESLVNNIRSCDEDTIHWFRCFDPNMVGEFHQTDNGLFPRRYVLDNLKSDYPPSLSSINSSCFIFNKKYLEYTAWECWYGDDYKTAASLAERISKNNIIDQPIINLVNGYGHGKDI